MEKQKDKKIKKWLWWVVSTLISFLLGVGSWSVYYDLNIFQKITNIIENRECVCIIKCDAESKTNETSSNTENYHEELEGYDKG